MNDVPASDYEGIDTRALDDSDNEISCDYRADGVDMPNTTKVIVAPHLPPLAPPQMAFLKQEAIS